MLEIIYLQQWRTQTMKRLKQKGREQWAQTINEMLLQPVHSIHYQDQKESKVGQGSGSARIYICIPCHFLRVAEHGAKEMRTKSPVHSREDFENVVPLGVNEVDVVYNNISRDSLHHSRGRPKMYTSKTECRCWFRPGY